ncbi:MAG TPA: SRPBCC family protein [Candidatus Nitrosotalea sp.]|nr:SRPBCC family protein [Candidatus Nitrosotalea sp.]
MKFAKSLEIDCSRERLFDLTQDYRRRLEWDPFLSKACLLEGEQTPHIGAKALCVDHHGFAMEVIYVAYKPPEVAAVKMTRGPFFLASFAGTWRFTEMAGGRTSLLFEYFYRLKWPFAILRRFVDATFTREITERLAALDKFARERVNVRALT